MQQYSLSLVNVSYLYNAEISWSENEDFLAKIYVKVWKLQAYYPGKSYRVHGLYQSSWTQVEPKTAR